jgi:hypothetical protein
MIEIAVTAHAHRTSTVPAIMMPRVIRFVRRRGSLANSATTPLPSRPEAQVDHNEVNLLLPGQGMAQLAPQWKIITPFRRPGIRQGG